ncbi:MULTISPECIES: hypothetical protein [unclassified Mesorhizobium]|uniref:hypothetical protein n=1 Tax=unclassified Mesorhizobium TaxID=325217 RepID=UPI0003CFC93D|nr:MULTISPECIES: hypothetical protein [unclassified Mesorhizobium]ESZ07176.1 hypothetical protein X736_11020 [Mesorhizobium sp. L2C089B000]WJI52571.1 hypothetical protein NLY44_07845 [Mesorhizobium sp. C089B]
MPLNVNGLVLAEVKRSIYRIALSIDDKPTDLLDPAWWVHVASRMRANDRIEVLGFGNEWFAELFVLEVGKIGGARVAFITEPVLLNNDAKVPALPELLVTWGGPSDMWKVVKRKDNSVVKDRFDTKEAGLAWIEERQPEKQAA